MKKLIALFVLGCAVALAALPVLRRQGKSIAPEVLRTAAGDPGAGDLAPLGQRMLAAESTYWRGEHDSARIAWTELLERPEIASDSARIAEIETWIGLASWRLGEYVAARTHGEFALALKQRLGLETTLPVSYNALGLLAWTEGRLRDAAQLYETGLTVAHRVNDVPTAIKLASNIGLVETEFARYDRARAGFERALAMARESGETRLEGNALTNLAMLDVRVGDAAAAIPRAIEARARYAQVDYATGEQNALGQLATAYAALGDLRRAFATLDSANLIATQHGLKQDVASNLEVMADLYRDAGDARKALQHYARAQQLNQELGMEVERGSVLRKMAEVHARLGAGDSATAAATEAARIHQSIGARSDELKDRLFLALRAGDEASADMRRAREIVAEIGTPVTRATLALARAQLAHERADHGAVLALLAADSSDISKVGFDAEAQAAVLRAVALASTSRTEAAAETALHARAVLEQVRATLPSAMLRASFAAQRADLYELLIATQLRLGRTADAFVTSEHARARDTGFSGKATPAIITAVQRVRALTDTVNALGEAVASGGVEERVHRDELSVALQEARNEYESLLARGAWRTARVEVPAVRQVQEVMQRDEVLLEYFVGRKNVYAFAISNTAVHARQLALSAPALLAKTRLARTALQARTPSGSEVLASLYEELLAPFGVDARRLIIAPHAALAYVPFAALRNRATGHYLIEGSVIEYVSSGAQLVRLRRAPGPSDVPAALVFQPFPRQLPGSRAEGRAVQRAWRVATVKRGRRASGSALRAALATDRIVHVSTHGALDPRAPLFSFLSVAGEAGRPDRFEIHDIYAAPVRAPLVFLSGCETGLGAASNTGYETGDDANTFAQALLSAGARAVVSTVWRIEDQSAAVLAERFYQHLQTGDAALALAHAQRTLLRSSRYRAPFYWAPYMLAGEVSFHERERSRSD